VLKAKNAELALSCQMQTAKLVHAELISETRKLRRNAYNKQTKRRNDSIAQLNSDTHKNEIVMEVLEEKFHKKGREFPVEVKEMAIETAGITSKSKNMTINTSMNINT
jgi:hypothetical protein